VIGYAVFLALNTAPIAGGADSSGYLNSARLIAEGRWTASPRPIGTLSRETLPPGIDRPLGFRPARDSPELAPTYPPGLPLHFAAVGRVFGWDAAPLVVLVAAALAGLLLLIGLGRELGLPLGWALAAALLLASCPLYVQYAIQPMSDVVATTYCIGAVWCGLRSRRSTASAVVAGVLTSVAILVRPTNVLVLLPLGIALGRRPAAWLAFGMGAAPGIGVLAFYNATLYGSALRSGYGDPSALFSLGHLLPTLLHFARWLNILFTPLPLLLILGLPRLRSRSPVAVGVLASWLGAFVLFYALYYFSRETWWYLRFILPALPALILGSLLVAHEASTWLAARFQPRHLRVAALFVLCLLTANAARLIDRLDVIHTKSDEIVYREAAEWTREHLPERAVVAVMQCSGSQFFYTDLPILRWDRVEPRRFEEISRALAASGWSLYAVLFPFEAKEEGGAFDHMPGHWVEIEALRHVRIFAMTPPG
jgi:hypothetical protein